MPSWRDSDIPRELSKKSGRPAEAYIFMLEVIDFLHTEINKSHMPVVGVKTETLLAAFFSYSIREFGLLAHHVLNELGFMTSSDVGDVVFDLIGAGVMSASSPDERKEFDQKYRYDAAFFAHRYHIVLSMTRI